MERTKEAIKEHLETKLLEIIDDPEGRKRETLKAIELLGKEYSMFVEQKKINIDVHTLVSQLGTTALKELSGEVIDVEVLPPAKKRITNG